VVAVAALTILALMIHTFLRPTALICLVAYFLVNIAVQARVFSQTSITVFAAVIGALLVLSFAFDYGAQFVAAIEFSSPYLWAAEFARPYSLFTEPLYRPERSYLALIAEDNALEGLRAKLESTSYFARIWLIDNYWLSIQEMILIFAKGLSVLIFLLLNFGILVLAVAVILLPIATLLHGIYLLSGWLKERLNVEAAARYPLGAGALLLVGEVISFALSIWVYFGLASG
ncbi:MAG: hypothetical protein AAF401_18190, partial [Pseudomonadota bacterium]